MNVKRQIAAGVGGEDAARALLCFLAGTHDVGKASPAFAVQVDALSDQMRQAGLAMRISIADRSRMPHGLAGQAMLERWLEAKYGWNYHQSRAIASVVGGHHGIPPSNSEVVDARMDTGSNAELLGGKQWHKVQNELLDHMATLTGATPYLAGDAWRAIPRPVLVLAAAVVVISDWLASNVSLFPLVEIGDTVPLPQPVGNDATRLNQAWRKVNLPEPWRPKPEQEAADVDELLRNRFDLPARATARPVQRAAITAAQEMDAAGILIIEAPMGEGKTEAALLAAEILAARSDAGGVLVALPTQATSDAMFGRVMKWIANQPRTDCGDNLLADGGPGEQEDQRRSVFLAHGKAWLNQDFEDLPRTRIQVCDVGRDETPIRSTKRIPDGGAYIDGWMQGRRKGVLADFVVGTIDQVLFGALKSRHVALRHLALARKVVVLDEIHAFDAYMNVYLERALEWLGAYGVPVVALSATLPSELRVKFITAYQKGRSQGQSVALTPKAGRRRRVKVSDLDEEHPVSAAENIVTASVVASASTETEQPMEAPMSSMLTYSVNGSARRIVPAPSDREQKIWLETVADEDVMGIVTDALADGGCAMVVRNTVSRAQDTYRELHERFANDPATDVVLLHSRFLAQDRKKRERDVVLRLGKPDAKGENPLGRDRLIVVGTQVVEQSLDIDVDLLVTDLAPTDLLLQRIGRLHRHAERRPERRPAKLRTARAIVAGVEDWAAQPPRPVKGSSLIYGDYLLLRAAAQVLVAIENGKGIELPRDIAPLVEAAYSDVELGAPSWQEAIARASRKRVQQRQVQEDRADVFRLPAVVSPRDGLTGWLDGSVGEADVQGARAQVRDSEDSIEVIVVQTDNADQWRIVDWVEEPASGRLLNRGQIPPRDQRRLLAACTVRLPASISGGRRGDDVVSHLEALMKQFDFAAWQDSPDLTGQLILPFGGNRRVELPGCALSYDPDTGLHVEFHQ